MRKIAAIVLGATLLGLPLISSASLYDRGVGLIYDSTLNVTWQKNANLIAENSFGLPFSSNSTYTIYQNGSMNWPGAQLWIDQMNRSNYLGYSNWRLPRIISEVGFNINCTSYDGSTECGFNISDNRNELAHLFYASLGNLGAFDKTGNGNPTQIVNVGPFLNVQMAHYWTGTSLPPIYGSNQAFTFSVGSGLKEWDSKELPYFNPFAWALRDGDVSAVPESNSLALLLAGLAWVALLVRKPVGLTEA